MKSIFIREIKSFFGSAVGYLVIAIFLIVNGLFLWVFDGDFNILNSGYADMSPFFNFSPWLFLFLIPAITMKSFSEERKQGTLELLLTKPIGIRAIVLGKFFGAFFLVIMSLLPTLVYIYILNSYEMQQNPLDYGAIMGSYFGLLFLSAGYCSIGIFTSTLSENQIVAFIMAIFLSFILYFGFEGVSQLVPDFSNLISKFGMDFHFKSMSRGVLDTRDICYFISMTVLFLTATITKLKTLKN